MSNGKFNEQEQKACFGDTIENMERIKASHNFFESDLEYAVSILSDAQEELERGDTETARQFINKAKHFMFKTNRAVREASDAS